MLHYRMLSICFFPYGLVNVEPELLHTYSKVYKADVILLIVRLAVLTAVTLTVPVVLFPVSNLCVCLSLS